jgi:hypothetical protein
MSSLYATQLPDAAREAFVHAMSRATIVTALVAALGAFIVWRCLPRVRMERSPRGISDRLLPQDSC